MVEPIPFFGLFDDGEDAVVYLREQVAMQQRRIDFLQQSVYDLQEKLTIAENKVAALSIPGMFEFQSYGWEMTRNEDNTYTIKPIPEDMP